MALGGVGGIAAVVRDYMYRHWEAERSFMSKSIPTADLRKRFIKDIDLWLANSKESKAKASNFEIGSYQRNNADNECSRFDSMAHALYLLGEKLGAISEDDYPQFKRSKE